ncbi:MAG: hypothetical protein KDA22_12515 [Phycisphaerales bacterium]|nr:hypothetical protein [Phycisphaerales bacterium]
MTEAPRRSNPLLAHDEPRIALPAVGMVLATILVGIGFAGVWVVAVNLLQQSDDVVRAGVAAAILTTACGLFSTTATLPWIPKPASTALLAWLAGSGFRMLFTLAAALLLYSAPPAGPLGGVAGARTAFLLAVAASFLLGLLVEVAVVARVVLKRLAGVEPAQR